MHGLMMTTPLMISSLIRHADRCHGDTEIVSRTVEGPIHRYTYREAHSRARRLANTLVRRGVTPGECVATLAWNGYRHFELYYAVSGMGAVIHTINPRLFPDQITYIVQSCRGSLLLLRPDLRAAYRTSRSLMQERQGLDRDDRSRPHAERCYPQPALLRGPTRRRERRFRLARVQREYPRRAVLHLWHHRQSQGGAVRTSLDPVARLCDLAA